MDQMKTKPCHVKNTGPGTRRPLLLARLGVLEGEKNKVDRFSRPKMNKCSLFTFVWHPAKLN